MGSADMEQLLEGVGDIYNTHLAGLDAGLGPLQDVLMRLLDAPGGAAGGAAAGAPPPPPGAPPPAPGAAGGGGGGGGGGAQEGGPQGGPQGGGVEGGGGRHCSMPMAGSGWWRGHGEPLPGAGTHCG